MDERFIIKTAETKHFKPKRGINLIDFIFSVPVWETAVGVCIGILLAAGVLGFFFVLRLILLEMKDDYRDAHDRG